MARYAGYRWTVTIYIRTYVGDIFGQGLVCDVHSVRVTPARSTTKRETLFDIYRYTINVFSSCLQTYMHAYTYTFCSYIHQTKP